MREIIDLRRIYLTERQRLDLEQILCGGFAPLSGFLEEEDYRSVVTSMRLADGALWPMPIVLDVPRSSIFEQGERVVLCDAYGYPISLFTITSIYKPDKQLEAQEVYGTQSSEHPGVRYLQDSGDVYLGGPVELIAYAPVYDFKKLRFMPQELKQEFKRRGWDAIVAFQTRNPMHRAHYEIVRSAMRESNAKALIHPVAGLTKEGDIDYVRRVRGYMRVVEKYFDDNAILALLPLAMRMAGPREALWHALIRKNYGATHFIVGRDHAGPGKNFYGPSDAQDLAKRHSAETGMKIMPMPELLFSGKKKKYLPASEIKPGDEPLRISGTRFREMLRENEQVPVWFSFPEVIEELRTERKTESGAVLFFTGLPSAGKTTIARLLYQRMLDMNVPRVQLLDGDVVRLHYRRKLGFDRNARNTNIKRMGALAERIARSGGIAICAAVAPYRESRDINRKNISKHSNYIEIFVDTPLEICEKRDAKGLYKKARAGLIKQFTGIDDPYEIPEKPEIILNTQLHSPEQSAQKILDNLSARGVL